MRPNDPDDAKALLLAHAPHLRKALAGRARETHGGVILARGVDTPQALRSFELVRELRALATGVAVGVAPLELVRALAAALSPIAARHLADPPTDGHLWVLVVLPSAVVAAPLTWDEPRHAPLPVDTGLGAFLRRWPETAHLAAQLDPEPRARGKTTFRLASVIDALEAFARIVDALPVAQPAQRDDAAKARAALPALRAKLRQAAN